MRGDDEQSGHLFSYLSPEQRVPADHPLRTIRVMTDDVLRRLSPRFDAISATTGRAMAPSSRPVAEHPHSTRRINIADQSTATNWIPTAGKDFWLIAGFYGPDKALFGKTCS